MLGISEKELKDKQDVARRIKDYVRSTLIDELISECKELNPWLPIDKNTPTDRVIWLFANGDKHLGNWEVGGVGDGLGYWSAIPFNNKIKPTHYQELPDDPKE